METPKVSLPSTALQSPPNEQAQISPLSRVNQLKQAPPYSPENKRYNNYEIGDGTTMLRHDSSTEVLF